MVHIGTAFASAFTRTHVVEHRGKKHELKFSYRNMVFDMFQVHRTSPMAATCHSAP